jgi:hypothetical protein
VTGIVEHKDASEAQRQIQEILMTFLMGHRDNIGDVVFALGVIVGELRQPAFQVYWPVDGEAG